MCGIYGVMDFKTPIDEQARAKMAVIDRQLAPRGPDAAGVWTSSCGQVALGHRRLAIIDLSPLGEQPMHSMTGRFSIVFNGEIYNYRELRSQLQSHYAFRSNSDTEVVLAAWQCWGERCLDRLRGMFAFILWDAEQRTVHVARDPFGIKPLYLRRTGRQIWFASQVKALTALAPGLTENQAARAGYFMWGSVPDPLTPFNEIDAVPAGHMMSWHMDAPDSRVTRNWFEFSKTFSAAARHEIDPDADPAQMLRNAMLDTVRAHLEADVPVGVFLSAGLDSTTLTALTRELAGHGADVQTVTLGFREYAGSPADESVLAQTVARQLGTHHTTVQISRDDFSAELPQLFAAMDQPSYDGVNTYFISKVTRQAGLKVALSGLGGDELFGGYPSFRQVPRLAESVPQWTQGIGRVVRGMTAGLAASIGKPKLAGMLEFAGSYDRAYQLRRGLFMPWELAQVMDPAHVESALQRLATLDQLAEIHAPADDPGIKVSLLESAWFMRHQLLRDADWASMAHGLELRVPLVDVQLWKAVMPLRLLSKPVGKRDMALTPLQRLPDAILRRPKTGFSIPVGQWLLEAETGEPVSSPAASLRPWAQRVWERWMASVPRHGQAGLDV